MKIKSNARVAYKKKMTDTKQGRHEQHQNKKIKQLQEQLNALQTAIKTMRSNQTNKWFRAVYQPLIQESLDKSVSVEKQIKLLKG